MMASFQDTAQSCLKKALLLFSYTNCPKEIGQNRSDLGLQPTHGNIFQPVLPPLFFLWAVLTDIAGPDKDEFLHLQSASRSAEGEIVQSSSFF